MEKKTFPRARCAGGPSVSSEHSETYTTSSVGTAARRIPRRRIVTDYSDKIRKIREIREFSAAHPRVSPTVLNAVIFYLEDGEIEKAQSKIKLDFDKFGLEADETLDFLDSLGLIDSKYQERLRYWKSKRKTAAELGVSEEELAHGVRMAHEVVSELIAEEEQDEQG